MNTKIPQIVRTATAVIAIAFGAQSLAQSDDARKASVPDSIVVMLESRMAEAPSARIPLRLRRETRCVAIFPSVIKAGVIVAGKRGKALVSCRGHDTGKWRPPLFDTPAEARIGLHAGVQDASIILLIVDNKGLKRLLDEKRSFSGDASVAAGPLGAGEQVKIGTSVVSYARTEGVFAGMQLGSSALTYDKAAGTKAYGEGPDPADVLFSELAVPANLARVQAVPTQFAPPKS
ncbi:MAG: lipid-binding SYLF domain-containing protein [Gammaproteobacteria bacterium]|jgi:lipid-binding SYLF domain-containing protein